MSTDERIERIAESILKYLQLRPQAADTLEGIHQWWVDWGHREESPALTEQALQRLMARGLMQCRELAGRQIWSGRRS